MTTAADDSAIEQAFEAFLAGRHVPEGEADLAAFAGAVRASAAVTGKPSAALAELLASGLLVDQPSPSARTAPRIRRRLAMFFPALLAKFAAAGALAQAAAGAGVVLVAFTTAGTAGVLPDSLQHGFATVADTVGVSVADPLDSDEDPLESDEELPPAVTSPTATDGTEQDDSATGADADESAPTAGDDAYTLEDWEAGPSQDQSFGDWVSEGARHGYADGTIISRMAREKHIVLPEETAEPATDTADDAEMTPAPSPSSTGHGNGNAGANRGSSENGNAGGTGNAGGHGHGNG